MSSSVGNLDTSTTFQLSIRNLPAPVVHLDENTSPGPVLIGRFSSLHNIIFNSFRLVLVLWRLLHPVLSFFSYVVTVSTIPEWVKKNEIYYCGDYWFMLIGISFWLVSLPSQGFSRVPRYILVKGVFLPISPCLGNVCPLSFALPCF